MIGRKNASILANLFSVPFKGALCVALFGCTLLCASGQEKWDAKNATYINSTYKFHWSLPVALEWEKVLPREAHSVFRADSPYSMTVLVNINNYGTGARLDVWDRYEDMKKALEMTATLTRERSGEEVSMLEIKKMEFNGVKAIRYVTINTIEDDTKSGAYYNMTYMFFKDGSMWSVSAKCHPIVYDEFGLDGLEALLVGFGFDSNTYR